MKQDQTILFQSPGQKNLQFTGEDLKTLGSVVEELVEQITESVVSIWNRLLYT